MRTDGRHVVVKRALFAALLLVALPLPVVAQQEDSTVFTLGEVVVTGKSDPAEATGTIYELTADDLRAMGARNAAEALRFVPGARVDTAPTSRSANGKGEQLGSLRGFDPRDIVVLIDGVPVYEPYFRVVDLRQIPVGDIARIQVSKGPTSVLYGPNGLGGVVNIVTKKGSGPPRARLEGSYGDVADYAGSGSVLGGWRGLEYFFAPRFEKSDGFRVPDDFRRTRNEDGKLRENSDFQDFALAGKAGYSKGIGSVALSASHYEFKGGIPFSMEASDPGTLWREGWRRTGVALHGEVAPVPLFALRGNLYYTRFFNTITTYTDTSLSAVASDGKAVSTYDNGVFGYALMPEFRLGKGGVVTLAGIYKLDRVRIQDENGGKWTAFGAETYSGGAQYGLRAGPVDVTAGAACHVYRRTETPGNDLGGDNTALDGQLGVAYAPLPLLQLYAGAARKSSFPDLKTLYGANGNPRLRPEYAIHVDAGVRVLPPSPVGFEGAFFYSRITDLIGKKDTGNDFTYENINSAWIRGVEATLRASALDRLLEATANYTFMQTRDERRDRRLKSLDFRPEHVFSVDGRVRAPFGLTFAAQYLYVSARKYEQAGTERQVRTLPEFGTVNARIAYTLAFDAKRVAVEFFVEGKNLFDVYYEMSPERAAPGRMLDGGIAVDF